MPTNKSCFGQEAGIKNLGMFAFCKISRPLLIVENWAPAVRRIFTSLCKEESSLSFSVSTNIGDLDLIQILKRGKYHISHIKTLELEQAIASSC